MLAFEEIDFNLRDVIESVTDLFAGRVVTKGIEINSLVSLDVLSAGYEMVYIEELVIHHHPSALRDSAQRRRLLARNAAWVAWMRLPLPEALSATLDALQTMLTERSPLRDVPLLIASIAWALSKRRVIGERVRSMRQLVLDDDARREAETDEPRPFRSTRIE